MVNKELVQYAEKIGQFYLEKNNGNYSDTRLEMEKLQIVDVAIPPTTITITTKRPGLLIGRRGENIDALEKYLGIKIRIEEAKPSAIDYLIPWPEDE